MKRLLTVALLAILALTTADARFRGGTSIGSIAPPTGITSLTITSTTTRQQGWTFGQAFREGDVAAGQFVTAPSGATSFQADERNFWPDGSLKFAVLSGVSSFMANTPVTISLQTTSTPPSGGNVAEPASLANTNVVLTTTGTTYSIASGGTYAPTLNCSTTGPSWTSGGTTAVCVRQILGHVMSEFDYYTPTSDPQIGIWWYVRAYAPNSCGAGCQSIEVQTEVENGWWNKASPSQKDYGVTVNVNGTATYSATIIGQDLGWPATSSNTSTAISYLGNITQFVPTGEQFYVNGATGTIFTVTSSSYSGLTGFTTINVAGGLPTITDLHGVGHFSHSRWGRVDWFSGGNALYPAHNTAYLALTKVVPNFGWRQAQSVALTMFTANSLNPTPFGSSAGRSYGDLNFALGATGGNPWIGPMPQWDALYFTTVDNTTSYTATQRQAIYTSIVGDTLSTGGFDQHFRDETTGRPPVWSSYPTESVYSGHRTSPPGLSGGNWNTPGASPPNWQSSEGQTHQPAEGFAAYLIDGRWPELEEVQDSAWMTVQDSENPTGAPLGTLVPIYPFTTTRGFAWGFRSVGDAAALSPTELGGTAPLAADTAVRNSFVASVSDTASFAKSVYIDGTQKLFGTANVTNGIGWIGQYDSYNNGPPYPAGQFWGGSWMVAFQGIVLGLVTDLQIEGLSSQDQANLTSVRNFVWLDTLETLQGPTTEYSAIQSWDYRRSITYERPYLTGSTTPTSNPPVFLATNQASLPYADYLTTFGLNDANLDSGIKQHGSDTDIPTNAPNSSAFADEDFGAFHQSVAAMAVEAGIAKSAARYSLLTSAPNYTPNFPDSPPNTNNASDEPQLSLAPRSFTPPCWYTLASHQTWIALDGTSAGPGCTKPSSVLNGSVAQLNAAYTAVGGHSWNTGNANVITPWSGGYVNTVGITAYPNNNYTATAVWMPGTFYCVGGGGHTDYYGDERYCFGPLESNAAQWYAPRAAATPPVLVQVVFNGSIVGTALTVNSIGTGTLAIGQSIYGVGVNPGTTITGGSGTSWILSSSQGTIASEAMYAALNSGSAAWQTPAGDFAADHSYDTQVYLPNQNWEIDAGRVFASQAGISVPVTSILQFNSASPNSVQPWTSGGQYPTGNSAYVAAYDPVNNKVWSVERAAGNLAYYDLTTGTWTADTGQRFNFVQNNTAATIDTKRGIFAWWNGATGLASPTFQLLFYQLSNGVSGSPFTPCTQALPTEPPATVGTSGGSIVYDPNADADWVWYNSGSTLYKIQAPSGSPYVAAGGSCNSGVQWTVTAVTPASGATPDAEAGSLPTDNATGDTGTYGRFAVDPNPNMPALILLNRVTSPIYVFKEEIVPSIQLMLLAPRTRGWRRRRRCRSKMRCAA